MVRKAALAAVLAAVITATAAAQPARSEWRPTGGAIQYWKTHLVSLARSDPWWRGYLNQRSGYTFAACKYDSRGVLTYGCTLKNYGQTLAFVGLVRFARCGYGYTMAPVVAGHPSLTKPFRFCG